MAANNASIQILRSYANTKPNNLLDGQLAYSFVSNTLYIGSNTANGNVVIEIGGKSTLETINTVFGVVNSVILIANSAFDQANSATANANIVGKIANSAFDRANSVAANSNTVGIIANSAFDQANVSTILANAAYRQANTGTIIANSAYDQANSATTNANIAFIHANAAYRQANIATTNADAAFAAANAANLFANIAYTTANAAYRQANIATINADASFAFANNIIAGNVAFANVLISNTGSIFFGSNTWAQSNRAAIFVTNADWAANLDINTLIPGDFYYDDTTDSIYIYTDFTTYNDFKDLTVRF